MKEQQKAKAIELMKQMDIYKPYIEGFKKETKYAFLSNLVDFGYIKNLKLKLK